MKWNVKPEPDKQTIARLSHELQIDENLAKLLVLRGINDFVEARKFFRPELKDLHDPYLMKDMDRAVKRILKAVENEENILVYGDYDVDGTTAVSLVTSYLLRNYPKVGTYIPDRYAEGYGISFQGIDYAEDNEMSLIIALDCGIKANDKVLYAHEKGIDFIICDHHLPGEVLPEAVAVLDPKRKDCTYPYKELCGCGIGFKLIQALAQQKGESADSLVSYLDLVATAIAADIVPITGENRVLASLGLQVINSNPRCGIEAITRQIKKDKLNITDVVFVIAPRINAAGRMKHGQYAVSLLMEEDTEKAKDIASEIEIYNSDRKVADKLIEEEALLQITENREEGNYTTVVYREDWHKGVIGIAASRLIETYYRPTLVFTKSHDKLAASARSVFGFDLYEALEQCSEYLVQFGGHKYAAGLTVLPENYQKFKKRFEEVVKESITEEMLFPQIDVDMHIDLRDLNPKFLRILKQFEPFGPENMKPVFLATGLVDNGYGRKVGGDGSHLKLNIINGTDTNTYNAIGFGLGNKYELIHSGKVFSAVFTVEENIWNGISSMQLNIKDIKTENSIEY